MLRWWLAGWLAGLTRLGSACSSLCGNFLLLLLFVDDEVGRGDCVFLSLVWEEEEEKREGEAIGENRCSWRVLGREPGTFFCFNIPDVTP